jgi:hypothetical protein
VTEDGTTADFSADEASILEVNLQELSTRIAAALGLTPQLIDDDPIADAHWIGSFEYRGARCPIYLILTPDDDAFDCAAMRIAGASKHPVLVLTPTPKRICRRLKECLGQSRVAVLAMSDLFGFDENGVLTSLRPANQVLPTAVMIAIGEEPLVDGVPDGNHIVYHGIEYEVKLSDREVTFLQVGLFKNEIELTELLNPKDGVLWKRRFTNSNLQRNLVSGVLTELNAKLIQTSPRIPVEFRLPRGSQGVLREDFDNGDC